MRANKGRATEASRQFLLGGIGSREYAAFLLYFRAFPVPSHAYGTAYHRL